MKLKKIYRDRLAKLANALDEQAKFKKYHVRFNFGDVCDLGMEKNKCGTVGCAIGLLPYVFPRNFKYDEDYDGDSRISLTMVGGGVGNGFYESRAFFGLREDDNVFASLFIPYASDDHDIDGLKLIETDDDTGPKVVAENIRRFLKVLDK